MRSPAIKGPYRNTSRPILGVTRNKRNLELRDDLSSFVYISEKGMTHGMGIASAWVAGKKEGEADDDVDKLGKEIPQGARGDGGSERTIDYFPTHSHNR
jgi:hypothetical protein